jgi:threonine dehydratase
MNLLKPMVDTWLEDVIKFQMSAFSVSVSETISRQKLWSSSPINNYTPFLVFPERPGATQKFLAGLESEWNVSLFHYRNHGDGKEKDIALFSSKQGKFL